MNNRLICVVIAILPFHLAGVGGMLQHMCWHFGREHFPRKMELPIHHRNVRSTTHAAGCARLHKQINFVFLKHRTVVCLSFFLGSYF